MKKIEEVQLDEKQNAFINATAQSLLDLLYTRLVNPNVPDFLKDDDIDIDYAFSLFGEEVRKEKEDRGYSNEIITESVDNYVRRL